MVPTNSISANAPCLSCGYNLRGLAADSICPECAHPIADSLHALDANILLARWLKRMLLAFVFLLIFFLLIYITTFLTHGHTSVRYITRHGRAFIYPDDIFRIVWPALLIPIAWLFQKPNSRAERRHWPAQILPPLVLFHLSLNVAIPILRQLTTDPSQMALFISYPIEPFLVTTELFLLLGIPIRISPRLHNSPMSREITWFRRVFITLLFLLNLNQLAIEIARIAYRHSAPPTGGYWLPPPWGSAINHILPFIYPLLSLLWIYLFILIARFALKIRATLRWMSFSQ